MRLDDAVDRFFTGYFATHERSPKTIAAYRIDLRQFIEHTGAGTALDSIKADFMEQWAASLKRAEYAPASIRRKFASVRVFFNYWVRHEEILRSPLWNLRLDLAPAKTLPKALSLDEVRRLLRQAELEVEEARRHEGEPSGRRLGRYALALRNRAILEVMCATGIRVGEVVALRLQDYDAEEGELLIQGKGARERLALVCHERSWEALDAYLGVRAVLPLDHDVIFVNNLRDPISTQAVGGILRSLAYRGKVSRKVTPHMLRHMVATQLVRAGVGLRVVQEVLGHSTIAMTARYAHVSKLDMKSVLKAHRTRM